METMKALVKKEANVGMYLNHVKASHQCSLSTIGIGLYNLFDLFYGQLTGQDIRVHKGWQRRG